jgi:outer membrane protein OmpA-like peptidoglycan-associated protein
VTLAKSAQGIVILMAASLIVSAGETPPGTAANKAGRSVSFVTCPQFRDTARQCWVAEHGGKVYYIGAIGLGTAPQLLHQVLVEGTAHDGQSSCDAINISPVHLSVLPEIDPHCNTVLPDNGTRPLDPSRFDAPPEVLSQIGAERSAPVPLTNDAHWSISFDFDSAFLNQLTQQQVESAAKAAAASVVASVAIAGRAAAVRLDDGTILSEDPSVANRRAEAIAKAFTGLGVDPKLIDVRVDPQLVAGDGVHDWEHRSVEIDVHLRR